ncbi:phage terminase large subunit [Sinorhizobium meliloti]|uniref:PBSX family phage terminase large subunit n=1 Tax=Rhizobium meliloti TaxID=382 RepID=UPI000B5ABAD5|nr:phage terminase large subunit [Sinorhizobium meliloti]ASJ58984.1 terminase [Sinorhizobium meliloti]MCK3783488.1 phage terminase large subunit [Sinorhizobium meliloti]MCK3787882.1 phage terminase large subunit [Sinorhizobium meliloti]MCK3794841.1 phage terminase large subunit [Sinorhizobium meliloti]UTG98946.1 phage terminase large subunit [Sinorhizobium meliloti]
MTTARIELPPKLIPVFAGEARYRCAYGGRGSGKTRTFAKMAAVRGYQLSQERKTGVIVCGREYMNSLQDSSFAEVKAAIQSEPWLAAHYEIGEKYIRTTDKRIEFAFIGLRHNLDSIKSKAKVHLIWVDEAEPVSETAWQKITPTIREEDSEIWVTWNPERKNSATHKRFRENTPHRCKIVEINYADNPWFPSVLEEERTNDLNSRPEQYAHIWEGDFVTVVEGAYYARALAQARQEGRIGKVAHDPLMPKKAYWDIGVSDATTIWIVQFVGPQIRLLDYYEAENQPLAAHIEWLRSNGHGNAECILPHDGEHRDAVTAIRFQDHISSAGFEVRTVPNQGKGAAMKRVEAARRLFPNMWFDKDKCSAGLDAIGWYHEKRDEERSVGLGPEHDWASHGADSFGLIAVDHEEPYSPSSRKRYSPRGASSSSWMAG